MNHIVLSGNLGREPRLYNAGTDSERVNFSIAVNRGRGDKQTTAWMDVTLFGPGASVVAERVVVGQELHVQGQLVCREQAKVTGQDGQQYDRPVWTLEAARFDGVTFGRLPGNGQASNGNGHSQAAEAAPAAAAAAKEEIPF